MKPVELQTVGIMPREVAAGWQLRPCMALALGLAFSLAQLQSCSWSIYLEDVFHSGDRRYIIFV